MKPPKYPTLGTLNGTVIDDNSQSENQVDRHKQFDPENTG